MPANNTEKFAAGFSKSIAKVRKAQKIFEAQVKIIGDTLDSVFIKDGKFIDMSHEQYAKHIEALPDGCWYAVELKREWHRRLKQGKIMNAVLVDLHKYLNEACTAMEQRDEEAVRKAILFAQLTMSKVAVVPVVLDDTDLGRGGVSIQGERKFARIKGMSEEKVLRVLCALLIELDNADKAGHGSLGGFYLRAAQQTINLYTGVKS